MDIIVIVYIALPLLGIVAGWLFRLLYAKFQLTSEEQKAERLKLDAIKEVEAQKKEIILKTREALQKERLEQEKEFREMRSDLKRQEKRLSNREDSCEAQTQSLQRRQSALDSRERKIHQGAKKLEQDIESWRKKVEKLADLTSEEAKSMLIQSLETEAQRDAQSLINKVEQDAAQDAQRLAQRLLVGSMQRIASEVSVENTTVSVQLPNQEMKGRIIGREGRNIRALETLTGVDIIIDDAGSEFVSLSCFDPVRREVARRSLEYLINDGRIHPTRIEEIVEKQKVDIQNYIFELGEKALFDLSIQNMNKEGISGIGRLHFRTSYGQNMLTHSLEVAHIAGMLAAELHADVVIAKRGGLLHDVGKALFSDADASHVELGVELAKRMKESEKVVNCIAAHHGDVPYICIEAAIVQIADTLSASRPGARKESLEAYIKRLRALESIALEFEGVKQAYAIQAGRELRVIIDHEALSDVDTRTIARDITKRIEKELSYSGRIRITLIRETRIIEYAR